MPEELALPFIDEERCTGCGDCVEACPAGALELVGGCVQLSRPQDCAFCGDCEEVCPQGAIQLSFVIALGEPADALRLPGDDLYRPVLDNLHDGVYILDRERRIRYWSRGAEQLTGYPAGEVVGKRCSENILVHVDEQGTNLCATSCPVAATIADGRLREAELYLHHKDGYRLPVLVRVTPIRDGQGGVVGAAEIFTSRPSPEREQVQELRRLALLDPLTELGNRRYGEVRLCSRMEELRRHALPFGVLFIDIDRFKSVNDTYGHEVGDEVLRMVGRTLELNVRSSDFVSRWGGEEFLVIASGVEADALRALAEKLRRMVEQAGLQVGTEFVQVTVSIGATIAQTEDQAESLWARADRLMYRAKLAGRNRVVVG